MNNLNISKITNQDDGFLISYYTEAGNRIIIVNEKNIVTELNKAFDDIKKINQEREKKEFEMRKFYNGAQTGCVATPLQDKVELIKAD